MLPPTRCDWSGQWKGIIPSALDNVVEALANCCWSLNFLCSQADHHVPDFHIISLIQLNISQVSVSVDWDWGWGRH